ncbi:diaminopimelate decarboxylase [Candidatus Bipolaricaulota bacterium]|nr:diaminopimelate decarboxylase [Candidatus Bipolaricaulota bacterium]
MKRTPPIERGEPFAYRDGELCCEDVPLRAIAAAHDTPCYVYSLHAIKARIAAFQEAFTEIDHLICYAVKANSAAAILRVAAKEGCGADVVSSGELLQALKAGIDPRKIVYAGIGKSARELKEAVQAGILMINVESPAELELLGRIAVQIGRSVRIALRVNPDINPKTHPYISTSLKKNKFGMTVGQALRGYKEAASAGLEPVGIHMHLGSQMLDLAPITSAVELVVALVEELRGKRFGIEYVNIGGGLGIDYRGTGAPGPVDLAKCILPLLRPAKVKLILEPGRAIVGRAGMLLTRVSYCKSGQDKRFVIVDAGMNDLIRPSLYAAYHEIRAVTPRNGEQVVDIVGPVCESADFFAHARRMPRIEPGDLLAIMDAGAYGFSMTSNYNSRLRAAEIMVRGNEYFLIRKRETYADLLRLEQLPDFLERD